MSDFAGNPGRTGHFRSRVSGPLAPAWTVATAGVIETQPLLGSDRVFLRTGGSVAAYDIRSGATAWERRLPIPAGVRAQGDVCPVTVQGKLILQAGSPGKNAGDPANGNDPDGSANDMGAYGGPGAASLP